MSNCPFQFLEMLKSDLRRANLLPDEGHRIGVRGILFLPLYRQTRVLALLRLAIHGPHWVERIARILLRALYFIDVGDDVRIGRAVRLPHPQGIILGNGVKIGDEVSIAQFVTIGGNFRKARDRDGVLQRLPVVGSRVVIGPGAVIGGPVVIGDHVVVGANAVITKDVPANRLAYGLSQISSREIVVDPSGSYCEI